jgi:hypothetical protein
MNETPRPAPPHFVPTLTEVVRPEPVVAPLAIPPEFASLLDDWPSGLSAASPSPQDTAGLQVESVVPAIVERILLRVELSLASRLQQTVDSVVEAQMRTLKLALRAQLSAVVLDAVTQAVRQETEPTQPDSPQR